MSAGGAIKWLVPMVKLAGRPIGVLLRKMKGAGLACWEGFATLPPVGKALLDLFIVCYLTAGAMYELQHGLAWVPFSGVLLIPAGCLALIAYTRTLALFRRR